MTDRILPKLSRGEIEIMKAIWADEPTRVSEVRDRINHHRRVPLARNTILTQMQRLVKKGWLQTVPQGRAHSYQSTLSKQDAERHMTADLRENLFGGSSISLVRCLLQENELSSEELSELQAMIDAQKT